MRRAHLQFENKSAVFFDLDGTLIDSVPDLADAGNKMLIELGRQTFEQSVFRRWIGNGARVMVQRALSGSDTIAEDLDPQLLERALATFFAIYRQNVCIKTVLYDGVLDTLKQLKARGLHLAVLTNKPFEFVEPINRSLEIHSLFDLVLGGDSLPDKKPHPAPLLHACKYFGIEPNQALMVGDSTNDIVAAHNADIQSIGLTYGYNYGKDIGLDNPALVLSDFADILKHV